MSVYLTSDQHFMHANIIGHASRPFETVEGMDAVLQTEWNKAIDSEDTVLFGGDLTLQGKTIAADLLDSLNGDIVFIRGNHDKVDRTIPQASRDEVAVRHMIRFTVGDFVFYFTHWPDDLPPTGGSVWGIHGHVHDDEDYPFIDATNQRVNVCVEKTEYRPISVSQIVSAIQDGETKATTRDC